MNQNRITPEKVTRPIQLLAAWLTGLVIIDATFLAAATQINTPTWGSGILVIASIANVPIFLVSIFLLQTKFRPQMQEDSYYSKFLEKQYNTKSSEVEVPDIENQIKSMVDNIVKELGVNEKIDKKPIERILHESQVENLATRFKESRSLSELYLSKNTWDSIVNEWSNNEEFIEDTEELIHNGLVSIINNDFHTCTLTKLGRDVAIYSEKNEMLYAQIRKEVWERVHKKVS